MEITFHNFTVICNSYYKIIASKFKIVLIKKKKENQ